MKHGQGECVWKTTNYDGTRSGNLHAGRQYMGHFVEDLMHGDGKLRYADGLRTYEGQFVGDREHGQGIISEDIYGDGMKSDVVVKCSKHLVNFEEGRMVEVLKEIKTVEKLARVEDPKSPVNFKNEKINEDMTVAQMR